MLLKPGLFRGDSVLSIALGVAAFLGAAHVLIRTSIYGIPIIGDTIIYVHFAETLAAGYGFEGRLVLWAPLLSVILAVFQLSGVEPSDAGRFLNIISVGLIVLIVGHWLHQYVRCRLIVIGAIVTIIVSYPLARVSSYVLAETLFILLITLILVQMESFLSGRRAKFTFFSTIVLSALIPLLRWMGISVIFTGVFLILTSRRFPMHVRLKRAAIYGTASSLPVGLWWTRNWIISGTLTGTRHEAAGQTLWDSLSQIGELVYLWTFARREPGWLALCLWAVGALIVLQATTFLITRRNLVIAFERWKVRMSSSEDSKARPALPFAAFVIVYCIALIIAMPYQLEHEIINRYLAPVYVPSAVAAAIWLDRFLLTTHQNGRISAWKNSDGWGIYYNKSSGLMGITKWILIGLIIGIVLANDIRNIALYIDVLITYDSYRYFF